MTAKTAWLCALALIGCGTSAVDRDGGPDPPADGAPPATCDGAGVLELGRCVSSEGTPCDGRQSAARFDPMPEDGVLAPVVGPQGSTMFALAARTTGIAPGDPDRPFSDDNPTVVVELLDEAGERVALYRGRAAFVPAPGAEGTFESPQLYVIVDEPPSSLAGHPFVARASLRDADREVRCGRLALIAGP